MVELLNADLNKEATAAEDEEKNSQEAYEKLMADAREKRAQDAKSVTAKSSTKAEQEEKCCSRERQERGNWEGADGNTGIHQLPPCRV